MCHISRINNEHNRCRKLYLLANKIIPQSVHVLLQCEEWCRVFKVVCRWLQCWCQREDCYSARHSGGSRLKEQPAPGAWRLLCVCVCVCMRVVRQSVWVHRKPIETPAGYHCQLLIKRGKECVWRPAHLPAFERAGKVGRMVTSPIFICNVFVCS